MSFLVDQRPNLTLGAVTDLPVLSCHLDSHCILAHQPQLRGAIIAQSKMLVTVQHGLFLSFTLV